MDLSNFGHPALCITRRVGNIGLRNVSRICQNFDVIGAKDL